MGVAALKFIGQGRGMVDFAQRFNDARAVDRNGAIHALIIEEATSKRRFIAVKNDADEFARRIHNGASRIASQDIGRGGEVEGRGEIQS